MVQRQLERATLVFLFLFFINLFLDRRGGWKKEREGNVNVWLPLICPSLGTWPTTQACALDWKSTHYPLVRSLALSPLSHPSQGYTGISWYCVGTAPCTLVTWHILEQARKAKGWTTTNLIVGWDACGPPRTGWGTCEELLSSSLPLTSQHFLEGCYKEVSPCLRVPMRYSFLPCPQPWGFR